ncbi:unnamed protein product [Effrenium voratum]|nr:unnamed protein product [Effrenium voratum]
MAAGAARVSAVQELDAKLRRFSARAESGSPASIVRTDRSAIQETFRSGWTRSPQVTPPGQMRRVFARAIRALQFLAFGDPLRTCRRAPADTPHTTSYQIATQWYWHRHSVPPAAACKSAQEKQCWNGSVGEAG